MKLSRTVIYALKATLQLAENRGGAPVPCRQLAASGGMPERFLLQILRNLVTHGILESTRGVDGGYVLVRSPKELTLLDVIEAIEGPVTMDLAFGEGLPEDSRQTLSIAMQEVADSLKRQFGSISLSNLTTQELPMQPTARKKHRPVARSRAVAAK